MVLLQIARDYHVLNKISDSLWWIAHILGVSKEAVFPLLIGVFFGISYGAGVIVETSKQGNLTKKDLFLLVIFLVTCHGMVEDTLIFVVIGASGWILVLLRTLAAILLTVFLSRRSIFSTNESVKSIEDK